MRRSILNRTVIIGIIGLVLITFAFGLNFWLNDDVVVAQDEMGQASSEVMKPQETPNLNENQATNENGNVAPEFDVVRIAENGDTVIAGRASPKSEVVILDGSTEIGRATADANGEWVFLPTEPLPSGSRELSIRSTQPDNSVTLSENIVILVVPEKGMDIAGRPSESPAQPLALLVPRDGEVGTSRILQKPSIAGSVESETGELSLDSIDYDDDGKLALAGHGLPSLNIHAYLDNKHIGETKVQPNGTWQLKPKEKIEPGVYMLRIDETKDENVIARLELPFSRAEPLKDFVDNAFIIVQPGNSLWRIARRTLGEGTRYTVLYQANQEQIGDPDLIYPGQIFEIPTN